MNDIRMVVNKISYLGYGIRRNLGDELKKRNFKKVFIVTDKGLVKAGVTSFIIDEIDKVKLKYEVFDDVHQNPTIKDVQNGVDAFNASSSDVIIALGGGSAMDTAKAISIIANNKDNYDVVSLEGIDKAKNDSVFLIAFPTTAGTGSETTMDYVITNEEETRKMACMDTKAMVDIAFMDVQLMETLPKNIKAATGMDALTHAIESYTCVGANTFSDMYSLKAIELIANNLIDSTRNDIEAMENMALASYLAGRSFTNVGLGIVHSLAHPLSAHYHIQHGVANGLMLSYVMEYNLDSNYKKFKDIALCLGVKDKGSDEDIAKKGIDAVRNMLKTLDLPMKLSEVGVDDKKLDILSESAFLDASTADNLKEVDEDKLKQIYIKAL